MSDLPIRGGPIAPGPEDLAWVVATLKQIQQASRARDYRMEQLSIAMNDLQARVDTQFEVRDREIDGFMNEIRLLMGQFRSLQEHNAEHHADIPSSTHVRHLYDSAIILEYVLAILSFWMGLWLLIFPVFSSSPSFRIMAAVVGWAPNGQLVWSVAMLLLGSMRMLGVAKRWYDVRRAVALCGSIMWTFLLIIFAFTNYQGFAIPIYGTICAMSIFVHASLRAQPVREQ